jgi:hypothetical protein
MPDPSVASVQPARSLSWSRALFAGLVATIVMTIVMMLTGMNIAKSLGSMLVGSKASPVAQYAVGGTMHVMIGLIYGVIFAWLVGRVVEWNRFIKGTVYGLAIAAIALAVMPAMSAMVGGGSAGKAANPCHPQAMNPCHSSEGPMASAGALNACHPRSPAAANPCHAKSDAGNPCGGGGGSPYSGVMSVINHLIYGLTLAFVYGKSGRS